MREEAEYLRLAVAMGLVTQDEVVAWADRLISALNEPPIQLIDVSLAGSLPAFEVMRLLAAVPGDGDLASAAHQALGLLLQRFQAGEIPVELAAEMLSAYGQWASVPSDEGESASSFRDIAYDLQHGYYGTPESVREDVERFLARHTTVAPDAEQNAVADGGS